MQHKFSQEYAESAQKYIKLLTRVECRIVNWNEHNPDEYPYAIEVLEDEKSKVQAFWQSLHHSNDDMPIVHNKPGYVYLRPNNGDVIAAAERHEELIRQLQKVLSRIGWFKWYNPLAWITEGFRWFVGIPSLIGKPKESIRNALTFITYYSDPLTIEDFQLLGSLGFSFPATLDSAVDTAPVQLESTRPFPQPMGVDTSGQYFGPTHPYATYLLTFFEASFSPTVMNNLSIPALQKTTDGKWCLYIKDTRINHPTDDFSEDVINVNLSSAQPESIHITSADWTITSSVDGSKTYMLTIPDGQVANFEKNANVWAKDNGWDVTTASAAPELD